MIITVCVFNIKWQIINAYLERDQTINKIGSVKSCERLRRRGIRKFIGGEGHVA